MPSIMVGSREKPYFFIQLNSRIQDDISIENVEVCVYVKKHDTDMTMIRDQLMTYIGGQSHVQCETHRMPLIVSKENKCCYQHVEGSSDLCGRKISLRCPDLHCNCGICKKCEGNMTLSGDIFISPNNNIIQIDEDVGDTETDSTGDTDLQSVDSANELGGTDDHPDSVELGMDQEPDNINDFVIFGGNDDIPQEEVFPEFFPTTLAGDEPFQVIEDVNKYHYVNGHVIMNQCGSLLNRNDKEIIGYRSQKYFLQRLASVCTKMTIPLLYVEGMLFPSIFWSMDTRSGAILGSIPSGLLTTNTSHGFASMKSHARCRLTLPGTCTSTNPSYVAFVYDILTNLTLNREDSRIILNRGLMESTGETGLKVRSREDTLLSDSVDSKQTVRNLCSSQKYHKMDFFLTFTCNQSEHFGMAPIKKWLDSGLWKNNFPGFDTLSLWEQEEITKGMNQSAAGILLRTWMEVRKMFIAYLSISEDSPYHPSDAIFSRDEYQSDVGNLPHMHMLISIKKESLTQSQMERLQDLVRASVGDILRPNEVQDLVHSGVLNEYSDIYKLQDLANEILAHKCSRRCLRRIGDGEGPENFKCRKPNNLKISP